VVVETNHQAVEFADGKLLTAGSTSQLVRIALAPMDGQYFLASSVKIKAIRLWDRRDAAPESPAKAHQINGQFSSVKSVIGLPSGTVEFGQW